jgi:hypothetical protein
MASGARDDLQVNLVAKKSRRSTPPVFNVRIYAFDH